MYIAIHELYICTYQSGRLYAERSYVRGIWKYVPKSSSFVLNIPRQNVPPVSVPFPHKPRKPALQKAGLGLICGCGLIYFYLLTRGSTGGGNEEALICR